jgi:hypothetical protein
MAGLHLRRSRAHEITALFALALVACSCSTTATITRANGPELEGKILGADREFIYVESYGGTKPVPKKHVTDIDHPGDAAAIVGGALTGYGIVNIGLGIEHCSANQAAYCALVFSPAAVGVGMLTWGIVVHSLSEEALHLPPPQRSVSFAPVVLVGDGSNHYGAAVGFGF